MREVLSYLLACALLFGAGAIGWMLLSFWIRRRWPASIPTELAFVHELESGAKLRDVAEELARRFRSPVGDVRCLGPTRGTAARVLFHAGPINRGRDVNIHRPDYVLQVSRLSARRVRLELGLNRPYTYFRANRSELAALTTALRDAFGPLDRLE